MRLTYQINAKNEPDELRSAVHSKEWNGPRS